MTFSFPEGLAPEVYPLAWLVGRWRGPGFVEYPDIPKRAVVTEAEFSSDGGPYLAYTSTSWLLEGELAGIEEKVELDTLAAGEVWSTESGFWRVAPTVPDDARRITDGGGAGPVDLDVLLADPNGHVAVYVGQAHTARIELATDVVARTETGAQISAGQRIYGLVQSELFWAHDLAAFGNELQSYASGRLQRLT